MGLHSIAFDDHGHFVLYIPSLNISAYGDTLEEAQEMLEVVLEDYCESTKAKLPIVTIDKSLEKYKTKVLFQEKLDKANEVLKKRGTS